MCVCVCVWACPSRRDFSVAQPCLTLCNPMDCSPSGSSIHWTLQLRILKWVAIPFSRESSWLREDSGSHICLLPDSGSPALLTDSSLSEPPGYWVQLNYFTKHFQNQSHRTASELPECGQHCINRPTSFLFWTPELSTETWFSALHCLSPNPLCSDNPKLSPLYCLNIDFLFYMNDKLSSYTLTPFVDHLVYFIFFWLCPNYIFLTVLNKFSKNWEEQQPN